MVREDTNHGYKGYFSFRVWWPTKRYTASSTNHCFFFGNQVLVLLGGNGPALRFIPMEKSGCSLQSGLGGAVSGTIRGCNVREIAVSRNK
jgi:hypothetical protein